MSTSILYRLARPGGEYNALYAMAKRRGLVADGLGWPTVVAEQDGKRVGFLSTLPLKDMIVAGPLVIDSDTRRPWTFLRLVESYENVLRAAGVTEYLFTVDTTTHGDYASQIERVCGEPVLRDGNMATYKRSLK